MTHTAKFLLFSILCSVPFVAQAIQKAYSARLTAQSDAVHAQAAQTLSDAKKAEDAPAWHTDPQFAAGEWKIEVQIPNCDTASIEPIWDPKNPNKMTIECHLMPVPTR